MHADFKKENDSEFLSLIQLFYIKICKFPFVSLSVVTSNSN